MTSNIDIDYDSLTKYSESWVDYVHSHESVFQEILTSEPYKPEPVDDENIQQLVDEYYREVTEHWDALKAYTRQHQHDALDHVEAVTVHMNRMRIVEDENSQQFLNIR